jgi:hypothetical protein
MANLRMHFRFGMIGVAVLITAILLSSLATSAIAADQLPALRRYRDLKIYSTSTPDKSQSERIVAQTQFVNEGPIPLRIVARLDAFQTLSFRGAKFDSTLAPGESKVWPWSFIAPAELKQRQIISGSININGKRERDLYISVQGTDPASLADKGIEKIAERARVVATYAPRTQESIEAEVTYRDAHQPKLKLTLAAAGKTEYSIVMEAEPASKAEVVSDLQRVIKLQSGVDLPVTATANGPAIILRKTDLGADAKGLHDAYRLRTEEKNVLIESPSTNGLRNGVYGLLADHLGAHWFQPNELGEEIAIPKDKTVRLPELNEVRGSPWTSCSGSSWGRAPVWDRRNRAVINNGRMTFGHSWSSYINQNNYPLDKYPEYYARDRQGNIRRKGPDSNFCSTHPEVIEIVARQLNRYFKNEPDAIVSSIDPNDYAAMCLCDRCLALDKQYGQMEEDGKNVADRLLHFSKEIHDRLEPQFKDKFLGILVYAFQIELPKSAKPHPHHAGLICDMVWVYDHSRPWNDPTSSMNRHFYDLVKGWGKLLPQFGYYDYYGHWTFPGPWGMVHKMREDLPAFHDLGGTFLMLEAQANFATQGLNHYVLANLVWNLDIDVDIAMEKFFQEYYGPVAKPMRDYWLTNERLYALERPGANNPPRVAVRPESWTELQPCLAAATQAAANLPADQKRFADRVKVTSDGFDYSRRYFEYQQRFGEYARDSGTPIDRKAAIAFLREHQAFFEAIRKQYEGDTKGYWPPLTPPFLSLEVEPEIKAHEAHMAKAK